MSDIFDPVMRTLVNLDASQDDLDAALAASSADERAFAVEILDQRLEREQARLGEVDERLDELAVARSASEGEQTRLRRR